MTNSDKSAIRDGKAGSDKAKSQKIGRSKNKGYSTKRRTIRKSSNRGKSHWGNTRISTDRRSSNRDRST